VQRFLEDDEALLLTLATSSARGAGEETFVWAVTKTGLPTWIRSPVGRPTLQKWVRTLRCGLDETTWDDESGTLCDLLVDEARPGPADPLPFRFDVANDLYNALFSQFGSVLDGKRLLYVPSGPLKALPPQVLVKEPTPVAHHYAQYRGVKWLGRSTTITVMPSVDSIRTRESGTVHQSAPGAYLGFGDPVLSGNKDCPPSVQALPECPKFSPRGGVERPAQLSASPRPGRFMSANRRMPGNMPVATSCPLPETGFEIRCIAETLGVPQSYFLGDNFSKATLEDLSRRGELEKYQLLHFATHALTAGELLGEPALVLTPNPEVPGEDGLLRLSDIVQLRIRADWVALSACNTASGEDGNSEALAGLARAFFYAGARSLMVSHWAVNSRAAVSLTTVAVSAMRQTEVTSFADALRAAMIEMMDSDDHIQNT
jgi:CHAT domain-containing protein